MHPTPPFRRLLLTALAVAATALMAQPATAQSNVTISGILDLAARSVSNEGVGSMKSMVSGSNSTSRIIISGREDLGDGLSAGFHLEHGILADTGAQAAGNKLWDRRTTVSLSSKTLGELRLGRDFVPSYTNWSRYDPFAYVGVARTANFVSATPQGPIRAAFGSNGNTTVRSDNALQLLLPANPAGLAGLEGGLMVAPGEGGAVASGLAKLVGLRLGYAGKGFGVSAASTTSENSQTTAGKFRDTVVGGQVDLANMRLSGAWREFKYATSKQTLLLLGATATFGVHEVKASWTQANLSGKVGNTVIDANDASQWGLGYVYNMSKRTALYAAVAQISNDGAARFVISDGAPGIVAGGTSRGYEAGLRHRF
jgi:predicted porin